MYIVDSYIDMPSDREKGRFNALSHCFPQENKKQLRNRVTQLSNDAIGNMSQSVKNLELDQHSRMITNGLLSSLKNRLNILLSPIALPNQLNVRLADRLSIGSASPRNGPQFCSSIRCALLFEYFSDCWYCGHG